MFYNNNNNNEDNNNNNKPEIDETVNFSHIFHGYFAIFCSILAPHSRKGKTK